MILIIALLASAIASLAAIIRIFSSPKASFPRQKILLLAQERYQTNSEFPLQNKIAVVTGSTSGLGKQIALELFRLGATVIVASRSYNKIVDTVDSISRECPKSKGQLIVCNEQVLDSSDMSSVVAFSKWFCGEYNQLHFLVNNAGIIYLPDNMKFDPADPPVSKQGYDLAFATNYLGHFLLSDLLLPVLKRTPGSRILNIASSAHLTVDGSALHPCPIPSASQPAKSVGDFLNAYGNNKLAQIMHVKELQLELESEGRGDIKVLCACPGFTATGMLPHSPIGNMLRKVFFTPSAAAYTPMHCLLAAPETFSNCKLMTNFYNIWTDNYLGSVLFKIAVGLGLRAVFVGCIAIPWVIAFQNTSYGFHRSTPDKVVSDDTLTRKLFQWSRDEVKKYTIQ